MVTDNFPSIIHIFFVIHPFLGGFPKLRLEWPEPTHAPLIQQNDYDEDVEAPPSSKESSESERNPEEDQPLLGSSS